MSLLDIQADAQRVVDVCKGGGVDLIPASIGYALVAVDPNALEKIFMTKQRAASKRHPMMGTYELHKEFHIIEPRNAQIIKTITQDLEIPLAVLAPYRPDHPMVQKWDPDTREASTVDGKVVMMLGTGKLTDEIVRLLQKDNLCFQGSSANATGSGNNYRTEDVPEEIVKMGDLALDYGLCKHHIYGGASTIIDFSSPELEVVRIGACYETIKDLLQEILGHSTA